MSAMSDMYHTTLMFDVRIRSVTILTSYPSPWLYNFQVRQYHPCLASLCTLSAIKPLQHQVLRITSDPQKPTTALAGFSLCLRHLQHNVPAGRLKLVGPGASVSSIFEYKILA